VGFQLLIRAARNGADVRHAFGSIFTSGRNIPANPYLAWQWYSRSKKGQREAQELEQAGVQIKPEDKGI
jgi:hypothetical protein